MRSAIPGDRDAFKLVIRVNSRTPFRDRLWRAPEPNQAEDVVQDAFVKAWKARWLVRDPEKFPAWLATIARHRARDLARPRRTVPLEDELNETPDPCLTRHEISDRKPCEALDARSGWMANIQSTHIARSRGRFIV